MPDLKIKIVYSQSHTVFPKIIFSILVILAIIIVIQSIMKSRQERTSLFSLKNRHFFIHQYDKAKIFGTIILLIIYAFALKIIGFIASGIIFITMFNILFSGDQSKKGLVKSFLIATVETMLIWFIFGYLFNVTLP